MRCAVHCVNNVLGRQVYNATVFDEIEEMLGIHRGGMAHLFGLGNYDVNVIGEALKREGLAISWWDKRNDFATCEDLDDCHSLIVNRKAGFMSTRHWLCLRKLEGVWWNLDSRLGQPVAFTCRQELDAYITRALKEKDGECLFVKRDEEEEQQQGGVEGEGSKAE